MDLDVLNGPADEEPVGNMDKRVQEKSLPKEREPGNLVLTETSAPKGNGRKMDDKEDIMTVTVIREGREEILTINADNLPIQHQKGMLRFETTS